MSMQNGILLIIRIQLYRVECTKQICMKKVFFVLLILISNNLMSQTDLEVNISKDINFNSLLKLTDKLSLMPNIEGYISGFDKEKISHEGNSFIASISGFSIEEVEEINNQIQINLESIILKFPELKMMDEDAISLLIKNAAGLNDGNGAPLTTANKYYAPKS